MLRICGIVCNRVSIEKYWVIYCNINLRVIFENISFKGINIFFIFLIQNEIFCYKRQNMLNYIYIIKSYVLYIYG